MNNTAFTFESAIAKFFKAQGRDAQIHYVEAQAFCVSVVCHTANMIVDEFTFRLNRNHEICLVDNGRLVVLDEDRDAAAAKFVSRLNRLADPYGRLNR